jgi:Tol biopolymer transport system component
VDPEPFLKSAYGSHWNFATDRVVFMQTDATGYYRVYTMKPDGTDRRAVPQARVQVPSKHQGTADWHPSGRYLIFVAQKQTWSGRKMFGIPDYEAQPGFGRHDDLWLVRSDGTEARPLTNEADTKDQGVLCPLFSVDGRRIAWASRQPGGKYALKVADFVELPEPHLENIRSYRPGGEAYYETGGFTSDGQSLTYTSDQDTHSFWRSQIYRLDLESGKAMRLTHGNDYNEHPRVVPTPSGDWIIYMSTKGVDRFPGRIMLGTDWYAMRTDGSGAKRLTSMNVNRSDNPENFHAPQVAGSVAMAPSGDFLLGDVQDDLIRQTGLIRLVRLTCP